MRVTKIRRIWNEDNDEDYNNKCDGGYDYDDDDYDITMCNMTTIAITKKTITMRRGRSSLSIPAVRVVTNEEARSRVLPQP